MATWTTPPATTNKELSLGEVNFGVDSRMFVFAYQSSNTSGVVTDTSIPAYNRLVAFSTAELKQYENQNNILIMENDEPMPGSTDVIMYYDSQGTKTDSGLRLSSNGQIVGNLQISDQMKNIIFKAQYIDPPQYMPGMLYRAYAHVQYNNRVYRLRQGAPSPIITESETPDVIFWEDIGTFKPQFSVLPVYTAGNSYASGDYVVATNKLYQLNSNISDRIRALTDVPNPLYWQDNGVYDVTKHNPTTKYAPNAKYTAPTSGTDLYVAFSNAVYRLRVALPYTVSASDASPDMVDWEYMWPVYSATYTKNTIYTLSSTVVSNSRIYQLVNALPFDSSAAAPDTYFWKDLGAYSNTSQAARVFRIVINTQKGSLIEFETDQNLHNLRVGELVGDIFINDIVASSSTLMTYTIPSVMLPKPHTDLVMTNGYYPYLPRGLSMSLDGRICGRPKGPVGKYFFDVQAQNTAGVAKHQRFYIEIIPGYTDETFSLSARLSQVYEREWYKMIGHEAFTKVKIYRESDPNYGLRTKPEILLKDNLIGSLNGSALTYEQSVALLRTKMDQEPIQCRVGNLRYRTALDLNGNPQYDYVYKELVPLSSYVQYSTVGQHPSSNVPLLVSLKENVANMCISDDEQLSTKGRFFEINNGEKIYLDTCLLWQTNPDEVNGIKPGVVFTIPVAYLEPGEGQKLIDASIENDAIRSMFFNKTITIETFILKRHIDTMDAESVITLKAQ